MSLGVKIRALTLILRLRTNFTIQNFIIEFEVRVFSSKVKDPVQSYCPKLGIRGYSDPTLDFRHIYVSTNF